MLLHVPAVYMACMVEGEHREGGVLISDGVHVQVLISSGQTNGTFTESNILQITGTNTERILAICHFGIRI